MPSIDNVKSELEAAFPEMSFRIGKRLFQECLIAKMTKYSGADIFVRENAIIIEAAIPENKTRLLIGAGAVFLKFFKKSYTEPSLRIKEFLGKIYDNVRVRQ